jgi:hypothetical protein
VNNTEAAGCVLSEDHGGPRITPILSQESQRLLHADASDKTARLITSYLPTIRDLSPARHSALHRLKFWLVDALCVALYGGALRRFLQ